jgi:hypothetical protein
LAVYLQKSEIVIEPAHTVLLIDQTSGLRVGALEGISASGGTWGSTTINIHCVWSPDSTILIVNYRTGWLMHSSQIYRIRDCRAIPLSLPEVTTHSKGRLLVGLQSTSNPVSEITLTKDGSVRMRNWGYGIDFTVEYSKRDLAGFEGEFLFDYRFDPLGQLYLYDLTVPSGL